MTDLETIAELRAENERLRAEASYVVACEWRDKFRACEAERDALRKVAGKLAAALKWVASHAYAGGKSFGDIEPVKSALASAAALLEGK